VGDDRVSSPDADGHEDISHNGSSGFGGNVDSAEMADLVRLTQPLPRAPFLGFPMEDLAHELQALLLPIRGGMSVVFWASVIFVLVVCMVTIR
jgi:hypothetical protein